MPHFRGIMDASFYPSVRVIGNIKVPQSGSSAGVETIVGYIADRKPGDTCITYPNRDTTANRCNDYLQPMFTESPRLKQLLTGKDDDMASLRIKLQTMLIYMCWSGSVTSLGNISAKYLIGDELDKWEVYPSKKETTSYLLFLERFRSFTFGAKAWISSTPTDESGFITQYMKNEAQVIFEYWITCPGCGHHQRLSFAQIKLLEPESDPQAIIDRDLARYCCSGCGEMLTDRQRKKALNDGVWHAKGDGRELFAYLRAVNPEKICFHSTALVTKLVSLNEIMSRRARAQNDEGALRYYDTQILARAHTPYKQSRKEDSIYILADDRPENLVPGGGKVACLVAAADTQDDGHPFEIRAFGWGITQESWQIRFGFCRTLAELAEVLFATDYRDAEGLYYPVHLAVIDAMGHRTAEVYDWTRQYPGRTQAYKGGAGRKANPQTWTVIDRYPGTKTVIPGGVRLVTCDTHHYKDQLAAKLRIKPDDPGAWHFHQGVTEKDPFGRAFAAEMCAEYVDARNLWQCPVGKPNHHWDVSQMLLVAADILQIKYWPQGQQ
ncbi:MAG: phage terminase large subunit family protein [Chlorobiales bacterium]|nr:phage terminase large subunit family protein [Chlorobiales bacterium]